jgi:hypothetical protein
LLINLNVVVLEDVKIRFDKEQMLKELHLDRYGDKIGGLFKFSDLLQESYNLIEPKVVYTVVKKEEIKNNELLILENGEVLKSKLLAEKLLCASELIPFLATIGPKLEEKVSLLAKENVLKSFILDKIGNYAVRKAREHLWRLIAKERKRIVSCFSPGDTPTWDLKQLEVLFRILLSDEKVKARVPVKLTESYLIIPRKSVCGVMGETMEPFMNCQVCKLRCEYRRTEFPKF